ncbi:hypothetical protein GGF31_006549 [Allomyces arbusculus]|nr:hypothetical protein GGF31_006549 [Allomyces arbusculus]
MMTVHADFDRAHRDRPVPVPAMAAAAGAAAHDDNHVHARERSPQRPLSYITAPAPSVTVSAVPASHTVPDSMAVDPAAATAETSNNNDLYVIDPRPVLPTPTTWTPSFLLPPPHELTCETCRALALASLTASAPHVTATPTSPAAAARAFGPGVLRVLAPWLSFMPSRAAVARSWVAHWSHGTPIRHDDDATVLSVTTAFGTALREMLKERRVKTLKSALHWLVFFALPRDAARIVPEPVRWVAAERAIWAVAADGGVVVLPTRGRGMRRQQKMQQVEECAVVGRATMCCPHAPMAAAAEGGGGDGSEWEVWAADAVAAA